MAHPSNAFPKNFVLLSSTNAYTSSEVFAIHNPTSAEITATVKGSILTYQTDAYKELTGTQTITIQPNGTLYGKFTSIQGAGLIGYI